MIATNGFKRLVVSEATSSDSAMQRLIDHGNEALADVLGGSAPLVEVQWGVVRDDRDRALIELTLRDWTGDVTARFAPWEFADDARLGRRLYSLWGDLLQKQSRIRFREMQEAVRQLDALDAREE
jgi:hypothetical protein